jgi:hypothetical protein
MWYKSFGITKETHDNYCINTKISVKPDNSISIKSKGMALLACSLAFSQTSQASRETTVLSLVTTFISVSLLVSR